MRFTTRQDALLTGLALVGGLVLLAAGAHERGDPQWSAPWWWRVVTFSVVCAAMLFRRTAPSRALLVATPAAVAEVLLGVSLATAIVYTDGLYAATTYGPRRIVGWLLGTTVAVSVLGALAQWAAAGTAGRGVVLGALLAVWLVGPVLSGIGIREHRESAEAERRRAEQVARLAELDRHNAVHAERARMARELHDVVANHLSAVALHSSAVLKLPDLDAEGIRRAMGVIRENSVQGLAEMRRMIGLLRDDSDETDVPAAPRLDRIDDLVRRATRPDLAAGLKEIGEPPAALPAPIELAAYRIVQESLTNVLKHAGPGRAEVVLEYRRDAVLIEVDSPLGGPGAALPGSGAGLIGMRERASLVGGTFHAGPVGDRWLVTAALPLEPEKGTDT